MSKLAKRIVGIIIGVAVLVTVVHAVTRDSIIHKCNRACELIKSVGIASAITAIENPEGEFVWNDKVNYIFVMDLKGKTIAHPFSPQDKKKPSMLGVTDKKGKLFVNEFVNVAKSEIGMGWVNYMWPLPGTTEPIVKSTFVCRVPETDYYVCSGMYVIKPGQYY